jgi:hypothetical protein
MQVGLALGKKKRVSNIASLLFKAPEWFPLSELYMELVTGDGHRAVTQFAQQLSALHALLDTCRTPVLQQRLHATTLLQLRSALKWLSRGIRMMEVRTLRSRCTCDPPATNTTAGKRGLSAATQWSE